LCTSGAIPSPIIAIPTHIKGSGGHIEHVQNMSAVFVPIRRSIQENIGRKISKAVGMILHLHFNNRILYRVSIIIGEYNFDITFPVRFNPRLCSCPPVGIRLHSLVDNIIAGKIININIPQVQGKDPSYLHCLLKKAQVDGGAHFSNSKNSTGFCNHINLSPAGTQRH